MHITLSDIGKRFNREWIYRHVNYSFEPDRPVVVLGGNGSGKSTLLRLLSGHLTPSEGEAAFVHDGTAVPQEQVYKKVAMAAPYLELYEDLHLEEAVALHCRFKPLRVGSKPQEVIEHLNLPVTGKKPLKNFSSGMRQRVKLGLAILSDTPLLLLDEPVSNLDQKGIDWYQELMEQHRPGRTVVVCSNTQKAEYAFCKDELRVEDFKTA